MSLTLETAIDAILGTFKVAWDANTPALTGGPVPVIVTEAIEQDLKPHPKDSTLSWTRIVVRHSTSIKATLAGAEGTARYRRFGIVWVQVFTPVIGGAKWTLGQQLAQVAQTAFEGKRSSPNEGVVFKNVSINERGKDGPWFLFDVKSEFQWDETK